MMPPEEGPPMERYGSRLSRRAFVVGAGGLGLVAGCGRLLWQDIAVEWRGSLLVERRPDAANELVQLEAPTPMPSSTPVPDTSFGSGM
jgi:hypothetical protein